MEPSTSQELEPCLFIKLEPELYCPPGAPTVKTEAPNPQAVTAAGDMKLSSSELLEPSFLIKLEPEWPVASEDPGPDPLALPVKPEPEAAIKTEADGPGGAEQAARAGAGPGRWLAAVRLSAADRAATEAQLPLQQSPAVANIKDELEFADVSDVERGMQSASEEERDSPKPHCRNRRLDSEFLQRQGQPPLCRRCDGLWLRRCAGPVAELAAAQHPGSDRGETLRRSRAQQQPVHSARCKDNPLQCRQCGKVFTRPFHLLQHERVHSGARPFVCPDCGAGFKQKAHLRVHSRTHTGEKPHRCAQCGRRFALLSALQRHERTHTGARPHACPDCGRRFSQAGHLRAHQRAVHLKQRPYACPDCGQCFTAKKSLHVHALMHSRTCAVCGRRFSQTSSLRRHSLIHSGQRPFSCDCCGRRFRLKHELQKHVQVHPATGAAAGGAEDSSTAGR